MAAPTGVKGYVDPYRLGDDTFAGLYLDVLEHIPDLTFPTSVPVYSKMRRDPKLSSILAGWNLNITRAQWQLDPAGCRPTVVKHVADGLGLAVKGKDTAGPARLRGVSWGDHLRAVMRMDPFGFAAFELEADVSAGKAQLAGLWERPQWTISHIHTDGKTGMLTGVTQDQGSDFKTPQIAADRMAFYSRDREGSNWAGTSLLRPSYASWLIKEEVRRAFAVANVRWSAGVPVLEALPGTEPTQAQMGEAAAVAQAARAGIQAGAATPPGFVMKILGITGSLPPTQEFLRWLDQQCAASALMNAFELGETPNGSRALGTAFMDALHLALEAEAEFVADQATRQIAARIVDWQFGEDEPVPRVVVSGVGSRREVTAESLQLLLSSGGLAADPGLEEWIRREWRLPEREDAPEQPVVAPGADLEVPKPGEQPTDSDPSTGQDPAFPDEGEPEADDLPTEVAARMADLDWGLFGGGSSNDEDEADEPAEVLAAQAPDRFAVALQQDWAQARDALLKRWPGIAGPMVDELTEQARDAAEVGDLAQFGQLAVSAGVIAAQATILGKSGSKLARQAADGVVAEAAEHDIVLDGDTEPGRVRDTATAVAHIIATGYASGAGRIALQLGGASPDEVADAVGEHLAGLSEAERGMVADQLGGLLSAAQHAGRLSVLEHAPPGTRFRANEVNDRNRCPACADVAGTEYPTLRAALADYPAAGFRSCAGRGRCRGHIAPVWT